MQRNFADLGPPLAEDACSEDVDEVRYARLVRWFQIIIGASLLVQAIGQVLLWLLGIPPGTFS